VRASSKDDGINRIKKKLSEFNLPYEEAYNDVIHIVRPLSILFVTVFK